MNGFLMGFLISQVILDIFFIREINFINNMILDILKALDFITKKIANDIKKERKKEKGE